MVGVTGKGSQERDEGFMVGAKAKGSHVPQRSCQPFRDPGYG